MQRLVLSLAMIFLVAGEGKSFAQHNIRDSSISFVMIGVTGAYQLPGGDMADRFGNNMNVGALFQWKSKTNWIAGFEWNLLFGDNVTEGNILDGYRTPDGNIIDGSGEYAEVTLAERGMKLELKGGKIFNFIGPNKNSGLMTTLGVGYLQHRIYIDTPGNPVPFLEDDYRNGFDRLCTGIELTEFVGYMNFSNSRLVNFYLGFELTQAFTKNRRPMNFDNGVTDDESRMDLLFGIRLGWVIPIYRRVAEKVYYN